MKHLFHKFALGMSRLLGSMWAFFLAIILMFVGGYYFGYTEKWTVESIVVISTFLMLFILQHSINVGERSTHLKLDELIRALEGARNEAISIEDKPEIQMDELKSTITEACSELQDAEENIKGAKENVQDAKANIKGAQDGLGRTGQDSHADARKI